MARGAQNHRVALVWHGDREAWESASVDGSRFAGLGAELRAQGLDPQALIYNDEFVADFLERALAFRCVLVWVNPIEQGRDRAILDGALNNLVERGIVVSAEPHVILAIGTKDVLVKTRSMPWGSDVVMYRTFEDLRDQLPLRLMAGQVRVLKQRRGHSGIGIWRVEAVTPTSATVRVKHAQRGSVEEELALEEFLQRLIPYFGHGGCVIDQAYQERLAEGMIRCYQVVDRVAGFGFQEVNALFPTPGDPQQVASQPGPRHYFPPDDRRFQRLKALLEEQWLPEMLAILGLEVRQLPLLWDADFLLGPVDAEGLDTYVLCEINVSSVSPFPQWAEAPLARAVRQRIEQHL